MWNLLSNAIRFTPKDGRIEVLLEHIDSQVQVTVSDNGIGIDKEFLPHVFERFRQADSSTTRLHGGLGLGLAIVRHLVELHGGSVAAKSDGRGSGAAFTVRLPVGSAGELSDRDTRSGTSQLEGVNPASVAPPDLTGIRVLVVDDEPDTLEVVSIMLKQFGADVRAAASSRSALEVFLEWQPNVLVSDVGMPGEDGINSSLK